LPTNETRQSLFKENSVADLKIEEAEIELFQLL
jgi:hypothetical protein